MVDGVVVREAAPDRAPLAPAPVAVQAAAVAGASFVAGRRRRRAGARRAAQARRPRPSRLGRGARGAGALEIVATRSFLVDVHLLDRR